MNHITALMLTQSIQRNHLEAARRRQDRPPRPVQRQQPERRSLWNGVLRVYQLGFASKP